MRTELLDSFAAVASFADQNHTGFSAEEYGYTLPDKNMIVNCEDPDLS
jgi:hypothetical protein